ncbi:DMT family transporter [Streptomyces cyaneofuscatus]|uniref:DMT family transporter n=1 Tax=Streptomyces cyaneofuscatus TaxID=66883 RepID=UPI0037F9D469
MKTKATGAYAWLLLTMVLWGSAFPSSKYAVEHVPHSVAAFLRFGGGAVVLVIICLIVRPKRPASAKDIIGACVAGLVGVFGYNALFFWGVTMAPASDGSVIFPALTPVITTVVLIASRRESARPVRIAGLVVGVGGAALFFLATSAHADGGSNRLMGDTIFLIGAAVWSLYTLLNRKLVSGMDPIQAVTISTVAGSVALGLMAAPDFGHVEWSGLGGGFWLNAVHLAIGPTAVAYLLYVRGIRDVGASTASIMMFAVPVFGTLFAFIALDESFTLTQVGAAVLMVAGALAAVVSGARKPAVEPPAPDPADAAVAPSGQPGDAGTKAAAPSGAGARQAGRL